MAADISGFVLSCVQNNPDKTILVLVQVLVKKFV